jgi:hypothetical protein
MALAHQEYVSDIVVIYLSVDPEMFQGGHQDSHEQYTSYQDLNEKLSVFAHFLRTLPDHQVAANIIIMTTLANSLADSP